MVGTYCDMNEILALNFERTQILKSAVKSATNISVLSQYPGSASVCAVVVAYSNRGNNRYKMCRTCSSLVVCVSI